MQNTKLVRLFRETGDARYYNMLCERHREQLELVAARYLAKQPHIDHQAIVNDTLLKFHDYCLSGEPLRHVYAWLCQTLKYGAQAALRHDRRQKRDSRRASSLDIWEANSILGSTNEPIDELVSREEFAHLKATVNDLPEPSQTVVKLRLAGRSNQWIATYLSLPLGTVKTHYRSAVARLRAVVE